MKYIVLLLLFPILLFGQDDIESKEKLAEIDVYVKQIDDVYQKSNEGIAEGPIIYKSIFKKNRG